MKKGALGLFKTILYIKKQTRELGAECKRSEEMVNMPSSRQRRPITFYLLPPENVLLATP